MDEMWSYVGNKKNQCWLWWAIDHKTGNVLGYTFGTREHSNLNNLLNILKPIDISTVYCDNNFAYKKYITYIPVIIGKKHTQIIESKHISLRTWCSRLVRKTIRFSKSFLLHRIVLGLIINFKFFHRPLPFHLL